MIFLRKCFSWKALYGVYGTALKAINQFNQWSSEKRVQQFPPSLCKCTIISTGRSSVLRTVRRPETFSQATHGGANTDVFRPFRQLEILEHAVSESNAGCFGLSKRRGLIECKRCYTSKQDVLEHTVSGSNTDVKWHGLKISAICASWPLPRRQVEVVFVHNHLLQSLHTCTAGETLPNNKTSRKASSTRPSGTS